MALSLARLWARRHGAYRRLVARTAPLTARALLHQLRWLAEPDALYPMFRRAGYYLLRDHYYRPFTDPEALPSDYWSRRSGLPGIAIDAERCFRLAETELAPYFAEFRATFPVDLPAPPGGFWLLNGTYMAVDAHLYYALIRHLRPRRIVEVGAGQSTLVAGEACRRNEADGARRSELVCIEPYPTGIVAGGLGHVARVVVSRVEEVELGFFAELGEGDLLFIDSSHALKEGGDVQFLYCEVLPRLNPGVLVHVHDISLPRPYPRVYFESGWFWNEQYLLQAFLVNNSRVEILWPGNYLMCQNPERMTGLFPEIVDMRRRFPSSEPTAFWFRTK
jgi:hypothetical protein